MEDILIVVEELIFPIDFVLLDTERYLILSLRFL